MKTLLQIIGYGWALMGAANIVMSPFWSDGGSDTMIAGLLMFNMLLFILPGLAVGGMGKTKEAK